MQETYKDDSMYDIVIMNGTVIDTVHVTKSILNIGICKGKISYIGKDHIVGVREIDGTNKIISPGFIDVHGHIDGYMYSGELAACQGITTTIGGNCGLSPMDMEAFFQEQENNGFYINQAELVGHSFSLRSKVGITDNYQKATDEQILKMVEIAELALIDGACGVSFGLDYSPGASLKEITALAKICANHNKVMAIHTRLFTEYDLYSLYEVLSIAKETGVKVLFSHFVYQYGNGAMEAALETIEHAIWQGLDIHIDSGMYTDWATFIGTETFSEQTIKDNGYVLGNMVVATGIYTGKCLTKELYTLLRRDYPGESVICFNGRKNDVYLALEKKYAMPSTDIGKYRKGEGHPQIAGTFPKYLIEMVREKKIFTIEEAICKATILPAQVFDLKGKGVIDVGADADIVVIDLDKLSDRATFPHLGKPDMKPIGIDYVIVNGKLIVDKGQFTKKLAGHIISL